jgi:hypothetical protein
MISDAPPNASPVAAFASPQADASPSIMTGRGLY